MKKKVTLFILLIFKVYISLVDFFHIWNLLNVLIKMAKKILIWAFLHVTIGIQIGEILLPTVQKEEYSCKECQLFLQRLKNRRLTSLNDVTDQLGPILLSTRSF